MRSDIHLYYIDQEWEIQVAKGYYILQTSVYRPRNNGKKRKQKETNKILWKWGILISVREPVEERVSLMIRELKTR